MVVTSDGGAAKVRVGRVSDSADAVTRNRGESEEGRSGKRREKCRVCEVVMRR